VYWYIVNTQRIARVKYLFFVVVNIMDQLDAEQLEQLKKCSTECLRFKLICVGEDEEAVIAMDRPKLLEAISRSMLASKDDGKFAQLSSDANSSNEVRSMETALEEKN